MKPASVRRTPVGRQFGQRRPVSPLRSGLGALRKVCPLKSVSAPRVPPHSGTSRLRVARWTLRPSLRLSRGPCFSRPFCPIRRDAAPCARTRAARGGALDRPAGEAGRRAACVPPRSATPSAPKSPNLRCRIHDVVSTIDFARSEERPGSVRSPAEPRSSVRMSSCPADLGNTCASSCVNPSW